MPPDCDPPPTADADAVLDVIVARDVADLGVPDFTLEDLRADWATPGLELEHDARVARRRRRDPRLRDPARRRRDRDRAPRRRGRGHRHACCGAGPRRARAERGTAVLRQFAAGSNDARAAPFCARPATRPRSTTSGCAPTSTTSRRAPAAALRTFDARARRGGRARADPGGVRRDRGARAPAARAWRAKTIAKDGHDPSLWLLLEDEEGLAGAALGERWEDGTGYVAELAVAARARGRGHGRTLLLGLFEAFRARRPERTPS